MMQNRFVGHCTARCANVVQKDWARYLSRHLEHTRLHMSPQSPIDAAKASVIAYNEKNWDRVKETVTPAVVYNELGTHRRITGSNEVIEAWKGWAKAMPDSKATFDREVSSGDTVTLELTWRGTHTGPLQTPNGEIAATGRQIEVQAVQVIDLADGKAQSIRHYFDMATLLGQLGVGK